MIAHMFLKGGLVMALKMASEMVFEGYHDGKECVTVNEVLSRLSCKRLMPTTERDADDVRSIGADFKRLEYRGTTLMDKTVNKGLTIRVDLDQVGGMKLAENLNDFGLRRRFVIELSGAVDALPRDFAASLYRVAQEAITNAAKHAQASRVTLRLRMREAAGADQHACIELAVDDDGKLADPMAKSGMGLLGMRERIAALGGVLSLENARPSGLVLRAQIPVPATTRLRETRDAA